jgi:bacillithiol system protein YtxJ
MNWIELISEEGLAEINSASKTKPVLLFKHSTSCSISNTVLNRLERNWKAEGVKGLQPYYLDLLSYRNLSNEIANRYQIEHQSPQVLIIQDEKVIYYSSHFDIDYAILKKQVEKFHR